jgi:hypothetical protein
MTVMTLDRPATRERVTIDTLIERRAAAEIAAMERMADRYAVATDAPGRFRPRRPVRLGNLQGVMC